MKQWISTALGAALACSGTLAAAQQAENPTLNFGGWAYELQLYLWGTEVSTTVLGEETTIGFDELLENLNFAIMGGLKAYNGPWMGYGELSYADVRQGGSTSKPTSGEGDLPDSIDAVADADIQTTIVSFGAGYRMLETPSTSLYGTFGARYLKMQSQMDLEIGAFSRSFENDVDYWDAVIGVMGRSAINDRWFVQYVADVGTGQSDLTWQLGAGVGYNLGRSDIVFGYRQLEWQFPDDKAITAYAQSGPLLLWNFRF